MRQLSSMQSRLHRSNPIATLLAVLLCVLGLTTAKADYDVLLDVSGSMAGFKREQESWNRLLANIESHANEKYIFGTSLRRIIDLPLSEVPLSDQKTFLGEALENWLDRSSVDSLVIITDNVADTQETDSLDSQKLFEKQVQTQFSHIAIVIISLPFRGQVYTPDGGRGRYYPGKRALSIYLLGRGDIRDSDFDAMQQQFKNLSGFRLQHIQIKPTFSTQVAEVGDIEITKYHGKTRVRMENNRLVISQHPLGRPLHLPFRVDIQTESAFELKDIELAAQITFDRIGHLADMGKIFADIDPKRTDLSPNSIKNFKIDFNISEFHFNDIDFKDQLAFALDESLSLDGELSINFEATRDNYRLPETLLNSWSYTGSPQSLDTPTEEVQNRIYRLGSSVLDLIPKEIPVQTLHTIPITLELRYPSGPVVSLLLLLLLLILVGFIMWTSLARGQTYVLVDDLDFEIPLSLSFGQSYSHYDEEQRLWFQLRSLGLFFWLSSPMKIRGSRFVSAGQTFTIQDPEMGDSSWHLRKMQKAKAKGVSPDEEWEY
jgi:hypothetical protein